MKKELSVTEYAKKIGRTRQAVLWQIKENKLPKNVSSKKIGNNWVITTKLLFLQS